MITLSTLIVAIFIILNIVTYIKTEPFSPVEMGLGFFILYGVTGFSSLGILCTLCIAYLP